MFYIPSDRQTSQIVMLDIMTSAVMIFEFGVAQGSVLGPTPFNIYVNDLLSLKCTGKVTAFPDDPTISFTADSWYRLKLKTEKN